MKKNIGSWLCALVLSGHAVISLAATVVTVESGQVSGAEEGGVVSWKGIAFAAPPINELRWRAPQPAPKWTGIRNTTTYGHDCMQEPFPSDAAPLGTPPAEDCLYVNVGRPAQGAARLPVVVWIYGGGFVNGGSSPPTYAGANVAKRGVAFVSFNYRVGRFGTFAHPRLTQEDPDHGFVGNYGYMDQLAALRWVQRNVAAFGGDPGNVTIIGESAGGASVHALVTSPLTEGLFHRAVIMSGGDGGTLSQRPATLSEVETIFVNFAKSKGIAPEDPQALAKLRALSAAEVTDGLNLAKLRAKEPRTFAGPFVDGKLAVDATTAYRSGNFRHVPMMIGATDADIGGKTGPMIAGARRVSALISAQKVPVYVYRFSYVADSIGRPGAAHASDIPYFFDNVAIKYGDKTTAKDAAMGRAIADYIVNFARRGDPNAPALPAWPRHDKAPDEIMNFTAEGNPLTQRDPWADEIDAVQSRTP